MEEAAKKHPKENNVAFPNQTHCPTVSPEGSSGVVIQTRVCKEHIPVKKNNTDMAYIIIYFSTFSILSFHRTFDYQKDNFGRHHNIAL